MGAQQEQLYHHHHHHYTFPMLLCKCSITIHDLIILSQLMILGDDDFFLEVCRLRVHSWCLLKIPIQR